MKTFTITSGINNGGGFNLYSNWRKVKNFKQGLAYFASGAVGGMVSVTNPVAGGFITSGGNVAIDVATGNVPDFKNSKTPIKDGLFYAGGVALDGLGAGGAGALSKFALKSLGFSIETMVHVAGASSPMVNTVAGEVVVEGAEWVVTGVKTPVAEMGVGAVNSLKPTHYITKSERVMKGFVNEIKLDGVINESIKYVEHNGSKFIVDGHHRFFAAQKLGIQNLPIKQVQLPFGSYQTTLDLILSGKQPGWWKFYNP